MVLSRAARIPPQRRAVQVRPRPNRPVADGFQGMVSRRFRQVHNLLPGEYRGLQESDQQLYSSSGASTVPTSSPTNGTATAAFSITATAEYAKRCGWKSPARRRLCSYRPTASSCPIFERRTSHHRRGSADPFPSEPSDGTADITLKAGRYRVKRALAFSNSKAEVHLAEDADTGTEVVISQARPQIPRSPWLDGRDRARLQKERAILELLCAHRYHSEARGLVSERIELLFG